MRGLRGRRGREPTDDAGRRGGVDAGAAGGASARALPRLSKGVWLAAGGFVAVELAVSARYGFHRDELYFLALGKRPAFGYVDEPPLAPLLTWVSTALLGGSPAAIRVLPALTGGGVVVAGSLIARELGGRRYAQLLCAVAVACAPVLLGAAHLAGTTVYDMFCWTVTILLVVMAVVRDRRRYWLGAGAVAGVGLENKSLILLLLLALGAGMALTRSRALLRCPWPWVGLAIAVAIWVPNLLWQAGHGWPALAMATALRAEHSSAGDYATVLR